MFAIILMVIDAIVFFTFLCIRTLLMCKIALTVSIVVALAWFIDECVTGWKD